MFARIPCNRILNAPHVYQLKSNTRLLCLSRRLSWSMLLPIVFTNYFHPESGVTPLYLFLMNLCKHEFMRFECFLSAQGHRKWRLPWARKIQVCRCFVFCSFSRLSHFSICFSDSHCHYSPFYVLLFHVPWVGTPKKCRRCFLCLYVHS